MSMFDDLGIPVNHDVEQGLKPGHPKKRRYALIILLLIITFFVIVAAI